MNTFYRFALAFIFILQLTKAQDCGLPCIANVNGTACAQSQWSCLCENDQYLEDLSTCARQACNQSDYDATIAEVAQLCAIFNDTATISPYATATTATQNPILSTMDLSTSLPSVVSSAGSATPSASQDIAGTSISTITTTGVPTASSPGSSATASSTTTNIAQRVDLRSTALHGIALALLGLAVYL